MKNVGDIDRKTYLGSGDISAILGLSPWRTPLDVFLDKTVGQQPITDEGRLKILNRGKRLEPYVIDMLCMEHDIQVTHRNHRYIDKTHPFIAAEIDAETTCGRNVEAKTTFDYYDRNDWGNELTDQIPVYYNAQGQHGMMVTDAPSTLFPVMLGIDDFRVYEVFRDEEVIAGIREAEVEFWDRIQRNDPPPATKVSDVLRMFPKDNGKKIQATDHILRVFNDLKAKTKELKFLDSECNDLADEIKLFMLDASALSYGARQLLTWKAQNTKRFDLDRFRATHPRIAGKFEKTTSSRVLRLKK